MARHARPARPLTPPTRAAVSKAITLGIAPALALSAFGPAAMAATSDQAPEGTTGATDSALADTATTEASVETIVVTEAAAADTDEVKDVTEAPPEPAAEAGSVEEGVVELDTTDAAGRAAGTVEAPDGFQTVGASWPREADATVPELQVRTRSADGDWSEWSQLERQVDSPDVQSAVVTSAPVYVGESDAVQVATVDPAQSVPEGVELALVSSEQVTTRAATTSGTVAASTATTGPTIITRAEWGAAPQCDLGEDYTGATWRPAPAGLKAAVVHHTVNPNDYDTVAEAMQAIRNDQAYHQSSTADGGNGWCDIGYNFLVDKWGNIYEGAAGSIDEAIIGAHAGGFNTSTVGVAMLGTFTTGTGVTPTTQQQDAVGDIVAYRLAAYGVAPTGTVTLTSAGANSKYSAGTQVALNRIFAHRDTHATECPGELGYQVLPDIRAAANQHYEDYRPAVVEERHTNLVQAVYKDSVGREARASEIAYWEENVATDGPTRLARAIETATSYRTARITQAYVTLWGEAPSSYVVKSQLSAIQSGARTVDEVELSILATPRYYEKVGGTKDAYVRALYAHLVHAKPTASQLTLWKSRLNTLGRAAVVKQIWNSSPATAVRINAAFRHYLAVTPTASQYSYWQARLAKSTRSDEALRYSILISPKYAARADARY